MSHDAEWFGRMVHSHRDELEQLAQLRRRRQLAAAQSKTRAPATPIADILAHVLTAPPSGGSRAVDRLESLERELALLLRAECPDVWHSAKRPLTALCRRARRALRDRDRNSEYSADRASSPANLSFKDS